ncbi:MAG: serpin family protein [Chitinophagaceae bacterium]|nr:MAG: serpin family protein [Chitinophagaceae bacterium]
MQRFSQNYCLTRKDAQIMKPFWIKRSFAAFPLLLLAAAGCNKNLVPVSSQPIKLPSDGEQVVAAQNEFALRLFKQTLQNDNSDANKLISPLSVYLDLSMVYNGAAGSTQTALQQAMQLNGIDTNLLNQTNEALITGLPKEDPAIQLNIANSIWYKNRGIQPLSSFLDITNKYYQSQVTGADFSPATVTQINNWVADATHQKINSIIQQIDPSDIMYLINAIYFKGQWKYSFNPKSTQNNTFYTSTGKQVQAPFMYQEDTFKYISDNSAQMIELPYGNGDFNMYVILPNEGISLHQFTGSFDENTLAGFSPNLKAQKVKLYLPKWKYSYEVNNMIPELSNMGMEVAFSNRADFSNMYPAASGIFINKVIHKTYIAVDEQGTEAAAVTAIGVVATSVGAGSQLPVMDVNRPFLYVIAEKNTGAILFIGEVNNPAELSN